MPIRWKLADLAKKQHLTAYALSAGTGISRQTLAKLMREPVVTRVNAETLATLCAYFGCKISALLEYVES